MILIILNDNNQRCTIGTCLCFFNGLRRAIRSAIRASNQCSFRFPRGSGDAHSRVTKKMKAPGNWWNKVPIKVILRKSIGRRVSHEDKIIYWRRIAMDRISPLGNLLRGNPTWPLPTWTTFWQPITSRRTRCKRRKKGCAAGDLGGGCERSTVHYVYCAWLIKVLD